MGSLTFGAFPRSGSHFFLNLASQTSVNVEWVAHHIHDLETKPNIVVSIRDPFECIPSWVVMKHDTRPDRASKVLEWYCAYYEAVRGLDLMVVPFKTLISDPVGIIQSACEHYGLESPKVESYMFDPSLGIHSPTVDKSGYNQIITEMRESPHAPQATELFDVLGGNR